MLINCTHQTHSCLLLAFLPPFSRDLLCPSDELGTQQWAKIVFASMKLTDQFGGSLLLYECPSEQASTFTDSNWQLPTPNPA